MAIGVDQHLDLGSAHLRAAFRNVLEPIELLFDIFVLIGADVIPDLGCRGDDVRLLAAVGDDVVNATGFLDVLAHVVGADVHQLDAVESAAPLVGTAGCVSRDAAKGELCGDARLRGAEVSAILGAGVPVQTRVKVGEQPGEQHVDFADQRLLGRRAIDADRPLELVLVIDMLGGQGGPDRASAERTMPAAMPRRSPRRRLARPRVLLRQLRQRIILRENADDRRARAILRHKRGRHPGDPFLHLEAVLLEDADEPSRGAMLFEADFRKGPDVLIAGDQLILERIEMLDDIGFDRRAGGLIGGVFARAAAEEEGGEKNEGEIATHGVSS